MLNHISIMGRLVADPELRYTPKGTPVCSFRIACDRDVKNPDGEYDTDFIDIVAWRSLAESIARRFTKGRMVIVDGRLQLRPWVDRDGNRHYAAEIVANRAYFGDRPKNERETEQPADDEGYPAAQQSRARVSLRRLPARLCTQRFRLPAQCRRPCGVLPGALLRRKVPVGDWGCAGYR